MKILIVTGLFPPDIGGPATYSRYLAEHLPRYGHTVSVISFGDVRKYWPLVRHVVLFARILSKGKDADVIYAQDTLSVGLPACVANLFLRKIFVVRVPGDQVWEKGTSSFGVAMPLEKFPLYGDNWPWFLTMMRGLQQFVVKRAAALVAPSAYMRKVVKRWGIDPAKAVLIYNGVEEIDNTGNKAVLRGLLKFQGKLLISVGRLVPWKGFDTLIRLMPRLKERFPELKLLIAGGGPLMGALEEKAASLSLSDDVIFTGDLERDVLIRYLRASDVFALNSRYEGLSHQILEAMSIGVPVVAGNVGGNPEVIEDGTSGYLVKPDDMEALYGRISALLADSALRAKIVAAGKRKVTQFSNLRMVAETHELLKRLYAAKI